MPSFITHIVFAEKIYPTLKQNTPNEQAFIVGNLFPDIRRLNVLKRDETHLTYIHKHAIDKSECFYTGFLTHNLLDIVFMQHSLRQKRVDKLGKYPFSWYQAYIALTMYLDMLFIKNLKHNLSYYNSILDKIELADISHWDILEPKHVKAWHTLLQSYFKKPPTSLDTAESTLLQWKYPRNQINKILKLLDLLTKNRAITKEAQSFIQDATHIFHSAQEWGRGRSSYNTGQTKFKV